jgi:hypothetical protein
VQVREKELELIRKTAVVKTANLCLVFAVPPAIALVIFATYAYSVGPLTPSMAFVVLSLFNTLRFPLVVLPKALRGASGQQDCCWVEACACSSSVGLLSFSHCSRHNPAWGDGQQHLAA